MLRLGTIVRLKSDIEYSDLKKGDEGVVIASLRDGEEARIYFPGRTDLDLNRYLVGPAGEKIVQVGLVMHSNFFEVVR